MPTGTMDGTWLIEYRKRPPTQTRPLTWRDYRLSEVVAPTRQKALDLWRWRYGAEGCDAVSVRLAAAQGPRWIAGTVGGPSTPAS